MNMDLDDEIPIHSDKNIVRRLRSANDRLSRNTFLSSMYLGDSKDIE